MRVELWIKTNLFFYKIKKKNIKPVGVSVMSSTLAMNVGCCFFYSFKVSQVKYLLNYVKNCCNFFLFLYNLPRIEIPNQRGLYHDSVLKKCISDVTRSQIRLDFKFFLLEIFLK